jgi:hypothetical protein
MSEENVCKLECEIYLKRKIQKNKFNKDNRPFSSREKRLIRNAFLSGFEHRYWKLRSKEVSG